MPYSLILDVLFAGLLVAALIYMARLNRRLDTLRSGREEFEALVKRFSAATEQAQSNVGAMRAAADGTGKNLQLEIDRARGLRDDLTFLVERANQLADQLEAAVSRSRAPSAGGFGAANVTRMTARADEPRAGIAGARSVDSGAGAGPAPVLPLSSGENELLRRLSTLR